MMDKLEFMYGDQIVEFYVLEQTQIGGIPYLLVMDSMEEDAEAYILKDMSETEDAEALYEVIEDEKELDSISKIFSEILEDVDIEIQ